MNAGQRVKIIAIAKKNSGNMAKALKLIDKIRKGLSDNPDVMDILKKANENIEEKVSVDRRTVGFKHAMLRKEKAKVKREAKKAAAAKTPKFNVDAHIDKGNYEYDGDVDEVLKRTNDMVMYGKRKEDAAANSIADGGVDMAPNAKKKKKSLNAIAKRSY